MILRFVKSLLYNGAKVSINKIKQCIYTCNVNFFFSKNSPFKELNQIRHIFIRVSGREISRLFLSLFLFLKQGTNLIFTKALRPFQVDLMPFE